jgi:hypothetical protein
MYESMKTSLFFTIKHSCSAGWLAGWLTGRLAGRLGGKLAGNLAGWQAGAWLAGAWMIGGEHCKTSQLADWKAREMAGWLAG